MAAGRQFRRSWSETWTHWVPGSEEGRNEKRLNRLFLLAYHIWWRQPERKPSKM